MNSHEKLNNNKEPIKEQDCEGLELLTEGSNGPLFENNRKLKTSADNQKK